MMPRFNPPRLRPTVAPRPTIVPKKPDPLPTEPPEVAPPPKTTIVPKKPDPLPTKPSKAPTADELLYPGQTTAVAVGQSSEDGTTSTPVTNMATGEKDVEPKSPGETTWTPPSTWGMFKLPSWLKNTPKEDGGNIVLGRKEGWGKKAVSHSVDNPAPTSGNNTVTTSPFDDDDSDQESAVINAVNNTVNSATGVYKPDQTSPNPTYEEPTSTYPGTKNYYTATEEELAEGEENYEDQGIDQSLQSSSGSGSIISGSSGSSRSSSVGGGYGKQRVAEQSRKQMNRTLGRSRSLLTS